MTDTYQQAILDALPATGKWGLALSGGNDSTALFHALVDLQIHFVAIHFNHGVIGELGDADEAFVRALCAAHAVPLHCGHGCVAPSPGTSLEMAARAARYAFFQEVYHSQSLDGLLMAHHGDDVAEHLLLRLARGGGCQSLASIKPDNTLHGMRVIRPWLTLARSQIPTYSHCEDISNRDTSIPRNHIRSLLTELPSLRQGLTQSAAILRDEDDYLAAATRALYQPQVTGSTTTLLISATTHCAIQRRLLVALLGDHATAARIARLLTDPTASESLTPTLTIRRQGECYELIKHACDEQPQAQLITQPGLYQWGEWAIDVTAATGFAKEGPDTCYLPQEPIEVRSRYAGERFQPRGLHGSRKLQDIMVDLKIPQAARASYPIFTQSASPVWLPAYRIAQTIDLAQDSPSWRIQATRGARM